MLPAKGRRRIFSAAVVGLTLLGALLVILPSATYAIPCNSTITTNTTLTAGLTCHAIQGLTIGANNIVLNCNHKTIAGMVGNALYGIEVSGYTGVTIENCVIKEFGTGIELLNGADGNYLINDYVTKSGGDNVLIQDSSGNTLIEVRAESSSGGNGVDLESATSNTFTSNIVNGNHLDGYSLDSASTGNSFVEDEASMNLQNGFSVAGGSNTFIDNTATANHAYGYYDTTTGAAVYPSYGTANSYEADAYQGDLSGGSSPVCAPVLAYYCQTTSPGYW